MSVLYTAKKMLLGSGKKTREREREKGEGEGERRKRSEETMPLDLLAYQQ